LLNPTLRWNLEDIITLLTNSSVNDPTKMLMEYSRCICRKQGVLSK
jgi:hypothetical protein